jgi:CheY-like chemotaxis protein
MTSIPIAEDNEMNRELLATALKYNDFMPLSAKDGAEAVKIAQLELPASRLSP